MDDPKDTSADLERPTPSRGRKVFATALIAAAAAYILLTTTGTIKPSNRLTGAEFGAIAIAALAACLALRPEFLDRLQKFDFAGIKLELGEMRRGQLEVQKQQQVQAAILEDVRMALRISIGRNEQQHLLKLLARETADYRVKGALREEIRRLRAMQLIRMRGSRTVGSMPDNAAFNLADYVELTEEGNSFASRLKERPELQARDAGAGP